jgi:hypothetical protein
VRRTTPEITPVDEGHPDGLEDPGGVLLVTIRIS